MKALYTEDFCQLVIGDFNSMEPPSKNMPTVPLVINSIMSIIDFSQTGHMGLALSSTVGEIYFNLRLRIIIINTCH